MTEEEKIRKRYKRTVIGLWLVSVVFVLSMPFWSKAEYDIGILFMLVLFGAGMVLTYFVNVRIYVLSEQLKPLLENAGIRTKDFKSAKVFLRFGRYKMALMRLKNIAISFPDNEELKKIIAIVEKHIEK